LSNFHEIIHIHCAWRLSTLFSYNWPWADYEEQALYVPGVKGGYHYNICQREHLQKGWPLENHEYIEQLITKQQTTLNPRLRSDGKAMTARDVPRFVWKSTY
jgi:hypothetical protein